MGAFGRLTLPGVRYILTDNRYGTQEFEWMYRSTVLPFGCMVSPYISIQGQLWITELCKGGTKDVKNPWHFEKVVLNLKCSRDMTPLSRRFSYSERQRASHPGGNAHRRQTCAKVGFWVQEAFPPCPQHLPAFDITHELVRVAGGNNWKYHLVSLMPLRLSGATMIWRVGGTWLVQQ